MAHTIEGEQPLASRTLLQNWLDMLGTRRAGLCLYHWLWIVLSVVGALAVVAPRVLSQPLVYHAVAETRFDAARYAGLYAGENPGPDFRIALQDATYALRQRALAQREVRFGSPDYRVEYVPQERGIVQVQGVAPTASEAQMLANDGAEELVRQVQAAGGREVLRNLLGWELVAAMRNEPLSSPFEYHLRNIIEHDAFPMSRPIEPVSARMEVGELTPQEQNDVTRALEARYNLWTFEINTRNATLDALCGTSGETSTAVREAALRSCVNAGDAVATDPGVADVAYRARLELESRDRAIARRQAVHGALRYMIDQQDQTFRPDTPGEAYRVAAELPAEPVARHIPLLLLLTVLMGLAFGGVGVAIDRSAGVMPKLRELWSYHELIRDLVVRDLRVRYKGSVLGYVWTQLAPLLMMLVFTFVFTFLMPSGIAVFPVFLIVGLLPWNYCNEAVSSGTRSVIDNANLIKKVFFPREILPLVSVFSSLLNYLFSLPMMFLVMGVTQLLILGQLNFSWTFLYLPVLVVIQTLFLIGMTLFVSALAVFFRDVVHLIGILMLFWFFLTPVFYALDTVSIPGLARVVRWVNPMASIVEFYREILYGNTVSVGMIPTPGLPALDSVLRLMVTVVLVLGFGYWFFQRNSGKFGELL
jgi:lipopolysaccharide transport system permease protein